MAQASEKLAKLTPEKLAEVVAYIEERLPADPSEEKIIQLEIPSSTPAG